MRLKSKKAFEFLYAPTSSKISSKHLQMRYLITEQSLQPGLEVAVSTPKRLARKAVVRNYFKRIVRESFRISKNELQALALSHQILIQCFFIYKRIPVEKKPYAIIREEVNELLLNLQKSILNNTPNV